MKVIRRRSFWHFLAPRYWGYWLFLVPIRMLTRLPFGWQLGLGRAIGHMLFHLLRSRKQVAIENIAKCLPALSEPERDDVLRAHFASLGMGLFETFTSWWGNPKQIEGNFTVTGLENLKRAEAKGKGVILLLPHFTHIDITGFFLGKITKIRPLYRRMNNPFLEEITRRGRDKVSSGAIPKDDIRQMLKALKQGDTVVFLPDQNFRHKYYELVPFFGIPTPTNVATSRIAKLSGASVLMLFVRRDGEQYRLEFLPELENFPSDDAIADTVRINRLIEAEIEQNPKQYLWVHRRFKAPNERQLAFKAKTGSSQRSVSSN